MFLRDRYQRAYPARSTLPMSFRIPRRARELWGSDRGSRGRRSGERVMCAPRTSRGRRTPPSVRATGAVASPPSLRAQPGLTDYRWSWGNFAFDDAHPASFRCSRTSVSAAVNAVERQRRPLLTDVSLVEDIDHPHYQPGAATSGVARAPARGGAIIKFRGVHGVRREPDTAGGRIEMALVREPFRTSRANGFRALSAAGRVETRSRTSSKPALAGRRLS
jgi:hypothetical protein